MKTNCKFHSYLADTADLAGMTDSSGVAALGAAPSSTGVGVSTSMPDPTGTTKVTGTTDIPDNCNLLCDRQCASSCCAILMLRFIAERCSDPVAFIEDARQLLEKYPVR